MKKFKGLINRMVAMSLSGMLVIGSATGSVYASEMDADPGQTSEVVLEDTSSEEDVTEEPMNAAAEQEAQYYTVTLDANGGYFVNEWDDVIGDYIESTEILNKQIPVGETVTTVPVFETDDQQTQAIVFSGWSLERDGELVSQGDEEYAPMDNCVLYAVWETSESVESPSNEESIEYPSDTPGNDISLREEGIEENDNDNPDDFDEDVYNDADHQQTEQGEIEEQEESTPDNGIEMGVEEENIDNNVKEEAVDSNEQKQVTTTDITPVKRNEESDTSKTSNDKNSLDAEWLNDIDPIQSTGYYYRNAELIEKIEDPQYSHAIEFDASYDTSAVYDLNKMYDTFSGTVCTGKPTGSGVFTVSIYCDGVLTHKISDVTKKNNYISFSLDVSDVSELEIRSHNSGSWGNGWVYLADGLLTYKASLSEIQLFESKDFVGVWEGEYDGFGGGTVVRRHFVLTIDECTVESGNIAKISGQRTISQSIEKPSEYYVNGIDTIAGTVNLKTGAMSFQGTEWIQYPEGSENTSGYSHHKYNGYMSPDKQSISGIVQNVKARTYYAEKSSSTTSSGLSNNRITLEDKYVLYENNQQDIIIRADVHSEDVVPNASNMPWLFGAYSGTSITPGSLSVEGGPTDYIASYSAAFSGAGEYEIKTILYNNENMEKKLAEASAVLHVLDLHSVGMPHVTDNVRKVSVAWTGVDDAEEYELQFTRIRTDEMGRESTYNINPIVTAETQYCLKTAAVLPGDTFKVTIVPVSHGLKGSPANIVGIYVQDDLESCVNELVAAMDDFLTTMNDEAERQRVSESPEEVKEKNTSAIASGARSENMITTALGTTDAELSAIYQGYSKFIVDHFTDYVKMENIDLSNNWTQIESAFVEYVQNNLNHEEETYEINGYTVKVVTTGYGNAIDGTIVLNKDGLQKQIVHISSTTDSVQQLMTKFSKNMQDIMEAAMYDALTSVINEIGDKTGIKDWTEAKAKSAFNKVLTALRNKGFGNILDNIQKMCNIYKAANSVLDILKADSVSEANKKAKSCYETLKKIEITTATAEYSTMTAPIKKAFDKVLDKRKALEKALQYMYGGSSGSEWTSGGGIGGEVSGVDDPESDEENAAYNVSNATVTGVSAKTYTGKAITQSLTVKIGSTILTPGTDYTVSYKNNTNAGTATVTVTGKGKYTGTKTVSFIINKAPQSITIKCTASSIDVGKTATVSITGAKGTKSYKASDTSVATVNASTGVVTGKKAGTVTITATSAATSNYNAASKTIKITVNKVLKKPGNCHFTKWNNSKYTSCRISWNKVDGAEGYQTLLSWTDGSHASETIVKSNVLYRDCTVVANHVSQMKVRAFYTAGGKRVYGPWSNVDYITPSPAKLTTKNASTGTNLKMNISWNIIYGCNGYNVFITTNPNGTWYWNQSTSEKATATSASIVKCGGAKLKKNTRYYVRIVTRRKRNGVFCTVPMPASNTYIGSFIIK